jgi:hypothetical protein
VDRGRAAAAGRRRPRRRRVRHQAGVARTKIGRALDGGMPGRLGRRRTRCTGRTPHCAPTCRPAASGMCWLSRPLIQEGVAVASSAAKPQPAHGARPLLQPPAELRMPHLVVLVSA